MSKTYNPGKLKPIIQIVAGIIKDDPKLHDDPKRLYATVCANIPELLDKTRCPNCDASMSQYEYNIDVLDIALVIGMAKDIKRRMTDGFDFTEANKIHVPTLPVSDAVRHRTTRCSKLGILAKHKIDGSQSKGTWVITKRGFDALRGLEIPTGTIVWRGRIIDRPDIKTTFEKVRNSYVGRIKDFERRNKRTPKSDHRDEMGSYNQNEWVDLAGYHSGKLF